MAEKEITYKDAFDRLEKILGLIENDQLDVDELSKKLKEASALLKTCKNKLLVANEEVKKILDNIE